MYNKFFNLTRNPFELSPDPVCFVPTERHSEALATIYYGVRERKGFVVVTGEVGTGKTLLLRCLLKLARKSSDLKYAYLFNTRITANEFLQYVAAEFGLPAMGSSKTELLLSIGKFLASRGAHNQTTVLVVDEAHLLSEDVLEEIRLLSNFEAADKKLLQIVLVGQPELNEKLESVNLRQLKQCITLRANLGKLRAGEVANYIYHRLKTAGAGEGANSIFPAESIEAVYRSSQGIPRLINSICDNALLAAYAKQSQVVLSDMVDTVAKELLLDTPAIDRAFTKAEHEQILPEILTVQEAPPKDPESDTFMKGIFEALQQAEAEHEQQAGTASASITELIERAEMRSGEHEASPAFAAQPLESLFARPASAAPPVADQRPDQPDPREKVHSFEGKIAFPDDFRTVQLTFPYRDRLATLADNTGPAAEAFRLLGVRLRHARRERKLKSVLISSTSPQEGKSMISANLACTLAGVSNQRVLLLEGDIRRPSLSELFQLESMPGLYEYVSGGCRLTESIAQLKDTGIWLMPAGKPTGNPLETLQSAEIPPMLEQLYKWFDWILVDSPPVLPLADTSVWARLVDGILLVARRGVSQKGKLKRGLEAIDPQKLIGAVLNSATSTADGDYSYYRQPSN